MDPELGTILKTADGSQTLPLHLHPEAANPELPDENLSNISTIFRTTWENLQRIAPAQLRKVFSRRHILVTDLPVDPIWAWNEYAAQELAPLTQPLSVQGNFFFLSRSPVANAFLILDLHRRDEKGQGTEQPVDNSPLERILRASPRVPPENEDPQESQRRAWLPTGEVLNCLDLPKGATELIQLPGHR